MYIHERDNWMDFRWDACHCPICSANTAFINGSPRKKWNTVKMLESAMKGAFSEEDKRKYRDEHFATDLQNAYELGKRLVGNCTAN